MRSHQAPRRGGRNRSVNDVVVGAEGNLVMFLAPLGDDENIVVVIVDGYRL